MEFALSEERQMLADTARRFIADRYDITARHANAKLDDGFSRDTWNELAERHQASLRVPFCAPRADEERCVVDRVPVPPDRVQQDRAGR